MTRSNRSVSAPSAPVAAPAPVDTTTTTAPVDTATTTTAPAPVVPVVNMLQTMPLIGQAYIVEVFKATMKARGQDPSAVMNNLFNGIVPSRGRPAFSEAEKNERKREKLKKALAALGG